jgi:hypothetical protein
LDFTERGGEILPCERFQFFLRHQYAVPAHMTQQNANVGLPQRLATNGLSGVRRV